MLKIEEVDGSIVDSWHSDALGRKLDDMRSVLCNIDGMDIVIEDIDNISLYNNIMHF